MFVDRQKELAYLGKEYNQPGSKFVVLYGRRRIGKTALIKEFCKDKRYIYYLATQEADQINRNAFSEAVAEALHNQLLSAAAGFDWNTIFSVIADSCANDDKLVLVFDEFQYLCRSNKAFASVLQKAWDDVLSKKNIMIILCGSLIKAMEEQVLEYGSPLYGRRTSQIRLQQLPFSSYTDFYPGMSGEQLLERYAVTGGVPKYIELFPAGEDVFSAIEDNILSPNAFLYSEPEFLLSNEVTETGSFFSLLRAIAAGKTKLGEIASVMETAQTNITRNIKLLCDLDILFRDIPATEKSADKSKLGEYRFKDNFMRFWFRYVYPNKSLLEMGRNNIVLDRIKKNFIEGHLSYVYENICRDWIWEAPIFEEYEFTHVGRWWNRKEPEIDICAYSDENDVLLLGECKYSVNKKGIRDLLRLKDKAINVQMSDKKHRDLHFAFFSRSGFDKDIVDLAKKDNTLHLYSGIPFADGSNT